MKIRLQLVVIFFISITQAQSPIAVIGTAVEGWTEDADLNNYWPTLYPNPTGDYYYAQIDLNEGYVKFVEVDNQDNIFGGTAFPSGEFSDDEIPVSAGLYTIELNMENNTYLFDAYPKVFLGYTSNFVFESDDLINFELPATEFSTGYQFINSYYDPAVMEPDEYGSNNFPTGIGNANHPIPIEAGYYKVFFSLATLFYSFDIPDVSLVGTALNGWPDEENETPDVFMESEDGFIYTLSNVFLEEGELKFREDSNWTVSWSGTNFPIGDLVGSDLDAIVVPESGFYDVEFNRQNQTYSFATLSSTDFNFNQVEIYPNPTQSSWQFSLGDFDFQKLQIYSVTGKLIFETKPSESQSEYLEIDGTYFDKGLYLAKLISNSGNVKTMKLIKN
jgi:hypothetical protein